MMKAQTRFLTVLILSVFVLTLAGGLLARERSEIDPVYTWDVTALYPSVEVFKQKKAEFVVHAHKVADYKGKLGDSSATLKQALDLVYDLEKELRRMESYTQRLADQDTRVSSNKALQQEVQTLRTQFVGQTSWIDPEIVALGSEKVEALLADPALADYRFPLRETMRRQKHILPPEQEAILAAAGDIDMVAYNAYNLLTNADMPMDTITLADGTEIKMNYPNYDKVRRSVVEADRKKAFASFFGTYDIYKRTIGEMLYGQMKVHTFYSKLRNYGSTLQAALDYDGIDRHIYLSLIAAAHENMATFHRYLKLKARALGKDKLDYTDIYMPFTPGGQIEIPYEKAQQMLLEAFQPLGEDYVNVVRQAFSDRWIDVYPNEGKDSGAYSSGWAYDVHPYVLMNYTGSYNEALTLAHELGHAMHSYKSNHAQPFPISYYSTFVAEVASTFNENLLNDTMLKKVKNDDEKLFLLGNFLDGSIKGTFFRQIQFAEFELIIHRKVETGEPLTGEILNEIFFDLVKKYYGVDQGVTNVPDYMAVEWAIVPHFYYNYYVFQYSTSIAASSLLTEKVINHEPGALERYHKLISSGGSDNPVTQLQNAGADLTNPAAYNALMARANRYMDEVEKILEKRGL